MRQYPTINKIESDLAFKKEKAIQTLDSLQMKIATHLILAFSFPRTDETKGWLKELNAWRLKLVQRNRGKKGSINLSHADLINGIWEEPLGEPGDRAARIKEIYNGKKGLIVPSLESRVDSFKQFVEKYVSSIESDVPFHI